MNLQGLKSLHLKREVPVGTDPAAEFQGGVDRVNRSPAEEMAARAALVDMGRLPDALAAIMLHETRSEAVTADGIVFRYLGSQYKYWHPESSTCHPQNLGKRIYVSFDRDCMDVIYILTQDGAYVETLPLKNKIQWFDPNMEQEIAANRRVIGHVHNLVRKAQAGKTEEIHRRTKSNAEKVQYLHNFPAPTSSAPASEEVETRIPEAVRDPVGDLPSRAMTPGGGGGHSAPDRGFATAPSDSRLSKVEALSRATQGVAAQRGRHNKKQQRITRETGTLDAIEPQRQAVSSEYMENSDLDKL